MDFIFRFCRSWCCLSICIFCLFVRLRILYCQLCLETAIEPAMVFLISRLNFVIFTVLPATQRTCRFSSREETKVFFVLHLHRRLDKNLQYWYLFTIATKWRGYLGMQYLVTPPKTGCLIRYPNTTQITPEAMREACSRRDGTKFANYSPGADTLEPIRCRTAGLGAHRCISNQL